MKPIIGERYHDLEEAFAAQVMQRAGLITNGHDVAPILEAVRLRLQKGAREYGDAQFWNADCVAEIREECLDIIGWGSLEYTKQLAKGNPRKANQLSTIASSAARMYVALDGYDAME